MSNIPSTVAAQAVQVVASQPWCAVVAIIAMLGGFGFSGYVGMEIVKSNFEIAKQMNEQSKILAVIASDTAAMRAAKERHAVFQ